MLAGTSMPARFANLVELQQRSCATYADRPLYGTKRGDGWHWITYGELASLVDRLRGGLASLGVGRGDRVAIVSNNRVEWVVAAYATYGLEAAFVPMYEAQRPSEWKFILGDSGAKVVLAATDAIDRQLCGMKPELRALEHVIGLELPADDPRSWQALLDAGARAPIEPRSPEPSSIAGFIYTSGTTGAPKGVLLSHQNIASNVSAVHEVYTFERDDRSLAFLPWAHAYGQTVEVHCLLSMGASVAINDDLSHLLANLAEVKPTILVAVPRIFNRIYAAVNAQIDERPALLRRMIRTGIRGAIKKQRGEPLGPIERVDLALDERLVFSRIRDRFGGRLKYAISASASLGHEVAELIDAVGLTVYEGYGLTETSPIVTANYPGARKLGSVGRVLPGIRVVIDRSVTDDPKSGEIVVYGPNVMVGYHARPEENERALMPDGGFRTGDLGYFDEDGFLYVTGRIKEQYKLENGKYVMPAPIEEELKLSPFVANVMVHGDGKPYNVALVVPDRAALAKWAHEHGHALPDDPTEDPRVHDLMRKELVAHSREIRRYERPRAFALVSEDFTIENGLLTPTLKVRRRDVLARHGERNEALYREPPSLSVDAPAHA